MSLISFDTNPEHVSLAEFVRRKRKVLPELV